MIAIGLSFGSGLSFGFGCNFDFDRNSGWSFDLDCNSALGCSSKQEAKAHYSHMELTPQSVHIEVFAVHVLPATL